MPRTDTSSLLLRRPDRNMPRNTIIHLSYVILATTGLLLLGLFALGRPAMASSSSELLQKYLAQTNFKNGKLEAPQLASLVGMYYAKDPLNQVQTLKSLHESGKEVKFLV